MITIKNPPEPKIERISNLISRIKSGDIKIPKFQRGFVWREDQILKLLESIYQGFPIGSLLFWLSEIQMKSERDIGGFELPRTPDKYPRNYVLDGQQRLTTIYGVLNWIDNNKLHKLNVYFDIEKQAFFNYQGERSEKQIPMNILFNTTEFLKFRTNLAKFQNNSLLQDNIDTLYETFREYLLPVVTIKEKTIDEVCPIFERINSTGTQLNVFDLMVAATWSNDFDLNDQVDKIKDSTRLKDFENIDNSIFLKIMSSIQGFGSKRDGIFKLRNLPSNALVELTSKVKISVEKAIDFLSTDLMIPSDSFLPYENQLVVFSYFFSKQPRPSSEQLSILRRWFWQSGFSEHYRGASEGILEYDLNSVDELLNGNTSALNIKVNIVENDLLKRQFWKASAFSKTFAVMLAKEKPCNITNGARIDTQNSLSIFNMKEFHHIFPKDFLKSFGIDEQKRNNICNICMLASSANKDILNRAPSEYLKECYKSLRNEANNVFTSNVIPTCSDSGWLNDNYELFLKQRAELLVEKIKSLC